MLGVECKSRVCCLERPIPAATAELDAPQETPVIGVGRIELDGLPRGGLGVVVPGLVAQDEAAHVVTECHCRLELDC